MEESSNFNHIVAKPLTEETKEAWFAWVKTYLISLDLWEVVSATARPPDEGKKGYARWSRKNAAALHVIRISCGPHDLDRMTRAPTARVAWDLLNIIYNSPPPQEIVRWTEEIEMYEAIEIEMYEAISDNNWSAVRALIDSHPRVFEVDFGKSIGETPLHVAARFGHVGIVEELVSRVHDPEYLEIHDTSGYTPLLIAAEQSGVIPIAKCLVNKNRNALAIPREGDKEELLPVQLAFITGLKQMGRYLYSVTPKQLLTENRERGSSFLGPCLAIGELDIVLDLLQRCEELLFAAGSPKISTIEWIAFLLPDSNDKSIKIPSTTNTEHFIADVQEDGENNITHQGLLHRLISSINNLSGMKEIYKMKQQHAQAAEILNLVCENVKSSDKDKMEKTVAALFDAARAEKVEFLLRVTKANPKLAMRFTSSLHLGHVFFDAVKHRRVEIFNLLRGFRFNHVLATAMNRDKVNFLDLAASLGPPSYLNRISGAALQMQRELQWFKAAESMVDFEYTKVLIKEDLNPLDFFKKNHEELRKDGERWMKDTACSCSVVGALIVTIMFTVAFTVPGGNDQASGYPIFLENKLFKVFLISDALSLFSSATSVLTFLGILTSRYSEEDFLYSLPKKLIIGLSTLFLSIATMMVAFAVTIVIMLQHNSSSLRVFLPIAMLGGVPITLFVLLQFPLLVEVVSSTYSPGILKKKVKKWP
ncbi:hypothetical protein K1719_043557 [Acacia pycnantha]|nr:hypothetical protein K1719_043557 [Acacia pycnantha]